MIMLSCIVLPVSGQGLPTPSRTPADADEVQVVAAFAIDRLSTEIATAMLASEVSPWKIEIPDSTSTAWRQVQAGLYAVLHGRPVAASDSFYRLISFDKITVRGDSLFASFTTAWLMYCPVSPTLVAPLGGGWAGGSSTVRVVSRRMSGYWMPAVERGGEVTDGGCLHKMK